MRKISKTEAKKQIDFFFQNIEDKNPKDVKKIKRLAARQNIPLKENRKKFCKKCLSPFQNSKIRIKNKMKIVTCPSCEHVVRMKLKN